MGSPEFLVVDCLGVGRSKEGTRFATRDVIGAGPRAIAGVLEKHRLQPSLVECSSVFQRPKDLKKFDVLLLTGMSADIPALRRTSRHWRRESGDNPLLVGGPVSADPFQAVARSGCDICVVGEAEETLEQLLESGLSGGELPEIDEMTRIEGIAFRDRGTIVTTGLTRPMTRKRFSQFHPSTRVVPMYRGYQAARVYVEVVRGCSNYLRTSLQLHDGRVCSHCEVCRSGALVNRNDCPLEIPPGCGYCGVPSFFGPSRSRDATEIKREVSELLDLGIRRIVLSGSDFLDYGRDLLVEPQPVTDPRKPEPNIKALESLLSELTSLNPVAKSEAVVMVENLKPNFVTEQTAALLGRYLTGTHVHLGCETGSEEHSESMGRPSSPLETLMAVRLLSEHKVRPYVYFIHGLPGENLATAGETAEIVGAMVKMGAERITVYRFRPLPMSSFSEFRGAPPSVRSPCARIVVSAARRANRTLIRRWVGRDVEAVVCDGGRKMVVCYPLRHGPVIEGIAGRERVEPGDIVEVHITSAPSDRKLRGRIVKIISKWKGYRESIPFASALRTGKP